MELYREQIWTVIVKHLNIREADTTIAAFTSEGEADRFATKHAEGRTDIEVYVRKARTWFPKGLVWMLDAIPAYANEFADPAFNPLALKLVVVDSDVVNAETGEVYLEHALARRR